MSATQQPGLQKSRKDLSIENLRGIAIVLMVAGHVIGNRSTDGIHVADDSWFRYFDYSLMYVRMPLFTVISGFIYAMRPVSTGAPKFLTKKMRRILLPLVSVGSIQFLIKAFTPGVNNPTDLSQMWKIYFFRFEQFWFLHAVFLCFATIVLLDFLRIPEKPGRWLTCVVLAVVAQQTSPTIELFCFTTGYLYLLPYFLLGYGLQRHRTFITRPQLLVPIIVTMVGGVALQQLAWYTGFEIDTERYSLLAAITGLTANVVLLEIVRHTKPQVQWLARLGSYSYSIFLFHIFGAAGSRILASKLGLEDKLGLFTLALTCGLIAPIVADEVIKRNRFLRTAFLGLKLDPSPASEPGQPGVLAQLSDSLAPERKATH